MIDSNVLYLKYRPSSFKEVIGQKEVVVSLASVIEKGVNRTFLFVGPSGTGKTTLARIAASRSGCREQDIEEIDAATYNGIEDMRRVTEPLSYKPIKGQRKAIIVDECHALSKAAWQSLLKNLEEPPEWLYWFLCTTDVGRVPDNIKTRCTKYELKPVTGPLLSDWLSGIAKQEGILKGTPDIVNLCAKEAGGSPRQALVNLGLCMACRSLGEASSLLKTAAEAEEPVALAKALMAGAQWPELKRILNDLKEYNPESVRQAVRGYLTAVILSSGSDKAAIRGAEILSCFAEPFPADGVSPVIVATMKAAYS